MVHSIKRCKMARFKKAALAFLRGHAARIVLIILEQVCVEQERRTAASIFRLKSEASSPKG